MIPWLIFAVVAVPPGRDRLCGDASPDRRFRASSLSDDEQVRARTEQEFAEAEAYEAKWLEEDKEMPRERFPSSTSPRPRCVQAVSAAPADTTATSRIGLWSDPGLGRDTT